MSAEQVSAAKRCNSIEDNIEILRSFVTFAYEQGMHEIGYDPLDELVAQLRTELDVARREAATFRRDTDVAIAALDDAKKLAMRQANEIRKLQRKYDDLLRDREMP